MYRLMNKQLKFHLFMYVNHHGYRPMAGLRIQLSDKTTLNALQPRHILVLLLWMGMWIGSSIERLSGSVPNVSYM